MSRMFAVAATCLLVAACSSTPTTAPPSDTQAKAAPAATTPVAEPVQTGESESQRIQRIVAALSANSVFFDYDNYQIKPEYRDLLKKEFDLLKSSPSLALTLEGNADERGSTEYNLALGQKRAETVKRALVLLGVPEAQLEAISFGKEKPRAACHEERCWADNRRVDFDARTR